MSKGKEYNSKSIKVLSDREHVRLRTNVYLGTMETTGFDIPIFSNEGLSIKHFSFIPAVYKAVGEIFDNSLDEFTKIDKTIKQLDITATPSEGMYVVADNGRGIPIDRHHQLTDKYTPEVALGMLRAGRNFEEANNEKGVVGMNGVGSACTNYCSSEFKIKIIRDGKRYLQTFHNGAEKVDPPKIIKVNGEDTGTTIEFKLDNKVFSDIALPDELMRNRAIEIAFNRPDVVVRYNGERFRYKKGFDDIIKTISKDYFKFETPEMQFYVVFDAYSGIDEAIFTWVNNSYLFDGGICNTQFTNAFYEAVADHLASAAKKVKCEVTKNDIRQNLLIFGFLKIANPKYDSQAKTRLTGPGLRTELQEMIAKDWATFAKKNKVWFEHVLETAHRRHHRAADDDATKNHEKKKIRSIQSLLDANPPDRNRSNCMLYIMEGDSAAGSIVEVRDPKIVAAYSLGGKINNTYGSTVAQVLQMGKLTDLLAAIGLTPGKKADRNLLRYGRVIIATDADYDGSDIFALLTCLFFHFWPELFDVNKPPFIFRLLAPNVVVSKGSKRIHFTDRNAFEASKDKYKGWTVEYMKGLGSMQIPDWEMIVNGITTEVLIPIQDVDNTMDSTLNLLFGPSADLRKQWLMAKEKVV